MKYSPHLNGVLSLGEGPVHRRQGLLGVNQARRMEDEKVLGGDGIFNKDTEQIRWRWLKEPT